MKKKLQFAAAFKKRNKCIILHTRLHVDDTAGIWYYNTILMHYYRARMGLYTLHNGRRFSFSIRYYIINILYSCFYNIDYDDITAVWFDDDAPDDENRIQYKN